ncbi:MAG TPA: ThuA domain-containing protein [Sphingomicrobium sp.]|nr:ThuA domain-containing protein [Sphingomicrobium sp.]
MRIKFLWLTGAAAALAGAGAAVGQSGGAVQTRPAFDRNGVPTGSEKPRIPGQNLAGMHVYLRAGLKTHGPGQHDYPQFLADWSKILTLHGAVVDGSFHAPTAAEIKNTDVIVMYKGDVGFMDGQERADLMAFVKRGGGLVMIHDALCGPDPTEMAMLVGGGKKHGEVNYTLDAKVPYTIVDPASPLMKGFPAMTLAPEESFYKMTWAKSPAIHVLATTVIDDTPAARQGGGVGQVVPQIWTYEHRLPGGQPARAFVWMQGHTYADLKNPQVIALLLRGIAWAGKHPVDELVDFKPLIPNNG